METQIKEEAFVFDVEKQTLPNVTVFLKAIVRGGELIEKDHPYAFMFPGVNRKYQLPGNKDRRGYKDPFSSKEEKDFLQKELGVESLNPNIKPGKNDFWDDYEVTITDEVKSKLGMKFDLSNPHDYLTFKVLLATGKAAPVNQPNAKYNLKYEYYFTTPKFEEKTKSSKANLTAKAFKAIGKLSVGTNDEKRAFYRLVTGMNLAPNIKDGELDDKLETLALEKPEMVVKISESNNMLDMMLIGKAVNQSIITIKNGEYFMKATGEKLAFDDNKATIQEAVKYINDISNQELKANLMEQISIAEK